MDCLFRSHDYLVYLTEMYPKLYTTKYFALFLKFHTLTNSLFLLMKLCNPIRKSKILDLRHSNQLALIFAQAGFCKLANQDASAKYFIKWKFYFIKFIKGTTSY